MHNIKSCTDISPWDISPWDTLPWIFRRWDTSPLGHFAVGTLRRLGHFAVGHFAVGALRKFSKSKNVFFLLENILRNFFFLI